MEGCTDVRTQRGTYVMENQCRIPIFIQFMAMGDQQLVERVLQPGEPEAMVK